MEEITILVAISVFMAGIFAMAGLRLWFITHQDVNMSKKVNGLCIDVGKIKKQLRDGSMGVVGQVQQTTISQDMTLDDVAEQLGFDKKELNNPLIRPLAEKLFQKFKSGQLNQDETEPDIPML